jgi:hypothetical protein
MPAMDAKGIDRQLIDDRFELLQRLGGGGMGLVWQARDIVLHREVALKEVRPQVSEDLKTDPAHMRILRERVLREARALARLHHPNVVTIHHIVDRADVPHPWLVMELVTGGSLQGRLDQAPLTPAEAVQVGRGVLAGLRTAHAADVHHRDVKPANILLREDGTPVLTDFGIAALPESTRLTATGDLIGSPEFIAPERIRGVEGDPASDLWSLAMTLYVAVEGHSPLRRATSMATLVAVLDEPIPPPVRSGPLASVLTAVLQRDPALRPDAEQLDRMFADAENDPSGRTGAYGVGAVPATGPGPAATPTPMPMPTDPHHAGQHTPPPPGHVPPPGQPYVPPQPAVPAGAVGYGQFPGNATPPADPFRQARSGHGPASRERRVAIVTTAVVVLGATLWFTLPALRDGTTDPNSPAPSANSSATAGADDARGTGGAGADDASDSGSGSAQDVLTPSGARSMVKALRSNSGGTKVKEASLYRDFAWIDAPTKADRSRYDQLEFRNGEMSRRNAGGILGADDALIDLDTIPWDKLPGLLKKADKDLGVKKPTNRYVNIGSDLITNKPYIRVYVTDDYGGGYLQADTKGKVLKTYPVE